jgi:MFS family permease
LRIALNHIQKRKLAMRDFAELEPASVLQGQRRLGASIQQGDLRSAAQVYRPWITVVAVFWTLGTLFGCTYALAAIAVSLETALALSRDGIGLIMGLAFGGIYIGAPISGALADRFDVRGIAVAGMVVLATAFYLGSLTEEPWQAIAVLGGGIGVAMGLLWSPSIAAIQTWFTARRALATGIACCGMGLGTLLIVPWIEESARLDGWRSAFVLMAMVSAGAGVLAAPWIVWGPQHSGRGKAKPGGPQKVSVRSLVSTRRFLLLGGSTALGGFVMLTALSHMAASAVDQGIGSAEAAGIVAVAGLASIPARILAGFLGDRFGRTRVLAGVYVFLGASYALWLMSDGLWLFWAFAALYGAAYGAAVVMRPAATADHYEGPHLATMVGVTYLTSFVGAVSGPVLYGVIRDTYGDYAIGQIASVLICLFAAALV